MKYFALSLLSVLAVSAQAQETKAIEDFNNSAVWKVSASDQVKATITPATGKDGGAMCLNYDFNGVSGYAVMARPLPIDFDPYFALQVDAKGTGASNAFQMKFTTDEGKNVWWHNRPQYVPTADWSTLTTRKRHVDFAWGPTKDRALKHTEMLEFVVASGDGGGKGQYCFDNLRYQKLGEPLTQFATPKWSKGTQADGFTVPASETTLVADLGVEREFGGLVLNWSEQKYAKQYTLETSLDNKTWQKVSEVNASNGGQDAFFLPESSARFIRLNMSHPTAESIELKAMDIKDIKFGLSLNQFIQDRASTMPKGQLPRGMTGEQVYWTILGVSGGLEQALMNEDGAIEPIKRGASLEPAVNVGDKRYTWADVKIEQTLLDGYKPVPTATWRAEGFDLEVTALGQGKGKNQSIIAQYRLTNTSNTAQTMELQLAVRPFQVNPPPQFLNIHGGVSQQKSMNWDNNTIKVGDVPFVQFTQKPDTRYTGTSKVGAWSAMQANSNNSVEDSFGFASMGAGYTVTLKPQELKTWYALMPQLGDKNAVKLPKQLDKWFAVQKQSTSQTWQKQLNKVDIQVPPVAQHYVDSMKTATAYILINREGKMIRPGTRSYARSWIRDGALTSTALSKVGQVDLGKTYADWFTNYLFASGKVPCCVDKRGADPVPENDSMGEYIYLISDVYAHTQDKAWLKGKWNSVKKAALYMDEIIAKDAADQAKKGETRFAGLLPPSISHEGYSDQAAYSMWDDYFGVLGYRHAARLGRVVGDNESAKHFDQRADELLAAVKRNIERVHNEKGTAYLPGAVDRPDFDATSSTIAFAPTETAYSMPIEWMQATYDEYMKNFTRRANGEMKWNEYTPYEWRNVGALIRLGRRDDVHTVSEYFMNDRRPVGWNVWAEVVDRQYRHARYLGDMPHGWVSSDYVRAMTDMFAFEENGQIVLGAGLQPNWLDGSGVAVKGLHLYSGAVDFTVKKVKVKKDAANGFAIEVSVKGKLTPQSKSKVWLNMPALSEWQGCSAPRKVEVKSLPAKVVLTKAMMCQP